MYEPWYGFAEKPFNLTPDPKYLFLSPRHTEAFAHLRFGHRERGGFVVITGEVGTGKTTVARSFLSQLGPDTSTAMVLYPAVTAAELLSSILDDFHLVAAGASLKGSVDALHHFLLAEKDRGRHVLLLIDEAQDLAPEVLEQVRLISNLETDTEKLLTIVLVGQSELSEMLSRRELRQLAQRVTARYHLLPLDRSQVADYVGHRLSVAGGASKVAFTTSAIQALHKATGGVPRLLNLVCDRALLAGYVKGERLIDAEMVKRAHLEVRGEIAHPPSSWPQLVAGLAVVGAVVGLLTLLAPRAGTDSTAAPEQASGSAAATSGPATSGETGSGVPVPLASASTARSASKPASPSEPGPLERALLASPGAASATQAFAAIELLWGPGLALQRTTFRTHFDQLRELDLAAILELYHPSRRDTSSLALLELGTDRAVVSIAGQAMSVPLSDLDRFWTRQATFLWRDLDQVGGTDRLEAWSRETLTQSGHATATTTLAEAVARFQRQAGLGVDGVVGSRSLMALYQLGSRPRPRLSNGGRG